MCVCVCDVVTVRPLGAAHESENHNHDQTADYRHDPYQQAPRRMILIMEAFDAHGDETPNRRGYRADQR